MASDGVSFALGLASVLAWGVAEIPQIVTNFSAGTTEGISLTFLLTWTLGDVFNLLGCYLEPATLPTQFYMAVLYTITTLVLVAQSFYYRLFGPKGEPAPDEVRQLLLDDPLLPQKAHAPTLPAPVPSVPVPVAAGQSSSTSIDVPGSRKSSMKDIYISSARSLTSSFNPTMGSFVPGSSSHLATTPHHPSSHGGSHGHGHSHFGRSPSGGTSGGQQGYGPSFVTRAVAFGVLLLGTARFGAQLQQATGGVVGVAGPSMGALPSSSALVFGPSSRRLLMSSVPRVVSALHSTEGPESSHVPLCACRERDILSQFVYYSYKNGNRDDSDEEEVEEYIVLK
eukprot:jgi/Mesen1/3565/ME000199S02715